MYFNNPLVSIIIASYNHKKYIAQTLDACVSQTYQNIEIIVVDDGSTDGSGEILKQYSEKYNNVHVFYQKNSGTSLALNYGIQKAKGSYIATTASDDIFHPQKIQHQLFVLQNNPHLSSVVTHVNFIDENSKQIQTPQYLTNVFNVKSMNRSKMLLKFFFDGNFLNASTALFPKDIFDKVGYFHPASLQLQDFDFYLKCLSVGNIEILSEKLLSYRISGNNLSSPQNTQRLENEYYFILLNLLKSLELNCTSEDLIKTIKKYGNRKDATKLNHFSKPLLVYLLCKYCGHHSNFGSPMLSLLAVQFLAKRIEEMQLHDLNAIHQLFEDLGKNAFCSSQNMIENKHKIQILEKQISQMRNSNSWKLTYPLRWLAGTFRHCFTSKQCR